MVLNLKPILFLLASFLVVTTRVSSEDDEFLTEAVYKVQAPPPAQIPAKAPAAAPIPPVKPPVPYTPPPPVKPPVIPPPPVKPPVLPPPPVKEPPTTPPTGIDCGKLCEERCKLHSRQTRCKRACNTCCARCKCVPPGTYGNREKCGKCYTDMTTTGGKPKCP